MSTDTSQRGIEVLVVEDDRDDFFLTSDLLKSIQREAHHVVWAASYDAAKLELEERSFDVALVDYRIDGRTGLEFIAQVGANFPHCPMILLTGLQDPGIDLAAQQAGAVDYLAKDSLTVELLDRSIRYARANTQRWSLLDKVLANAPAGVISLNAAGMPVVWNRRALEAINLDPVRSGPINGQVVRTALARLMVSGRLAEEFTCESGRAYQLGTTAGTDGGTVVVIHDISARARTEQLLRQAAAEAEAASEAKSNFLATVSHELRTPLNGILGMARVLQVTELDEAQREHVGVIRSSGEALLQIINDILDLSKIEAGRVELDEVDVEIEQLIDETIKLLAPTAFAKGLEFAVYVDPRLPQQMRGDPLRIRQVLINLIGNAIKFTSTGSVMLQARYETADQKPTVRFSVIDTGSGISPEKVDRLFKKFSQVDSSNTRNHSGTGLGLALCRELARLMQGTIWYEPGEAGGSQFHLRLPVPREHDAVEIARQGKVRAASGTTVVLVSRSPAIAQVLECYADAMGYRLVWAATERDATTTIAQNSPGVIMLDRFSGVEPQHLMAAVLPASRPPVLLTIDEYPARGARSSAGVVIDELLPRPFGLGVPSALLQQMEKAAARAQQPRAQQPAARKSRLKILMAEDNAPNRMVAQALLRSSGYELIFAEDGLEAVEKAQMATYDVILMDVQMPRLDGLEATCRIRAIEALKSVPIIGLTAGAMKQDRDLCLKAGMSDYLPKPVDWDKLLSLLEQIERAAKLKSSAA